MRSIEVDGKIWEYGFLIGDGRLENEEIGEFIKDVNNIDT